MICPLPLSIHQPGNSSLRAPNSVHPLCILANQFPHVCTTLDVVRPDGHAPFVASASTNGVDRIGRLFRSWPFYGNANSRTHTLNAHRCKYYAFTRCRTYNEKPDSIDTTSNDRRSRMHINGCGICLNAPKMRWVTRKSEAEKNGCPSRNLATGNEFNHKRSNYTIDLFDSRVIKWSIRRAQLGTLRFSYTRKNGDKRLWGKRALTHLFMSESFLLLVACATTFLATACFVPSAC